MSYLITVPSENVYEDRPRELGQCKRGVTAMREVITWVAVRAGGNGIDLVAYERGTQNGSSAVKGFRIVR
jgi:hypothetical protein